MTYLSFASLIKLPRGDEWQPAAADKRHTEVAVLCVLGRGDGLLVETYDPPSEGISQEFGLAVEV